MQISFNQLIMTQVVSDSDTISFEDALKTSMQTVIEGNVTSVGDKSVTDVKVAEVGRSGLHDRWPLSKLDKRKRKKEEKNSIKVSSPLEHMQTEINYLIIKLAS